jgi:hypothetical protein
MASLPDRRLTAYRSIQLDTIGTTQKGLREKLGVSRRTAQRYSEHGVTHYCMQSSRVWRILTIASFGQRHCEGQATTRATRTPEVSTFGTYLRLPQVK